MSEDVKRNKTKALVAASIAGIVALAGVAIMSAPAYAAGTHCYGINACKGTGDCGGKGHSCAGKNACKGQAWLSMPDEETFLKIQGGSLTPPAE